MAERGSLRERKKQRTRRELIEVSQRLFTEQGYEETTLDQICDEVEISVPTLLSYFTSKERLALAPDWDEFEKVKALIEDPERTEDTVSIWRQHVVDVADFTKSRKSSYIRQKRKEWKVPALLRGLLAIQTEFEDVLAQGIARDFGTDPATDLSTRMLATSLVFGHNTVFRHWVADGGKHDLIDNALAVIELATAKIPRPGSGATA